MVRTSDRNSEEGPGSNSGQISVYPWTKNEANARVLVAQLVRASETFIQKEAQVQNLLDLYAKYHGDRSP